MSQEVPEAPQQDRRNVYRGVLLVLAGGALLGLLAGGAAGFALGSPVLLDLTLAFAIAAGVLIAVVLERPPRLAAGQPEAAATAAEAEPATAAPTGEDSAAAGDEPEAAKAESPAIAEAGRRGPARPVAAPDQTRGWLAATAGTGGLAAAALVFWGVPSAPLAGAAAALAAGLCLAAAGLIAVAAQYFAGRPAAGAPALAAAPDLASGARVLAWLAVVAAASMAAAWQGRGALVLAAHLLLLAVIAAFCIGLLAATLRPPADGRPLFPLDLSLLSLLGSRANPLASLLDAVHRQLGIDLRSSWALEVVRRGTEPLILALCVLGWLSTSLTVVSVTEEALVERLGVPLPGEPLQPGLHLHWPWPIDRVERLPTRRVQAISIGHEGEEAADGPENVVWANQHAANEYTLLLGDGRDLLTVDSVLQYRIRDPRRWRYGCQNPAEALRAIAYRAVMRSTVHRTLAATLSENVVALTARMREMVQDDADRLGLGVEVVAFTVAGLHPPVAVAADYEAVVSAELSKVTAGVDAEAFRLGLLPATEAEVIRSLAAARSEGLAERARAAGQAWGFRTLRGELDAGRADFVFRRRLEALEKRLAGRSYTVVDARIQRDGGELWLMP